MNAPKKIWMTVDTEVWTTKSRVFNTPYIRADLVDELVEALKEVMDAHSDRVKELSYQKGILVGDSRLAKARAALAKLEDSHD